MIIFKDICRFTKEAEQERKITVQRIKDGIEASSKRSGRATGKLDKMSDELEADMQLLCESNLPLIKKFIKPYAAYEPKGTSFVHKEFKDSFLARGLKQRYNILIYFG